MAFLGQEEQIREYQDRFRYLYIAVFLGLFFLFSRLVYLQVLTGDRMRQYSEENRIKKVKIAAPRGMIFDRNGVLLVDNRPAFDLEIIPQYLRESKQGDTVIKLLSQLIVMKPDEINEILQKNRGQPAFIPVKIKNDLSREEVALIEAWKIDMPGVQIQQEIKRTNIHGDVAAHLLGYIGEVGQAEIPKLNKQGEKYKLGDNIGKFGIEEKLEDVLRGVDGEKLVEVDALGRIKLAKGRGRVLATEVEKAATPGKNVILTIDQDLQMAAIKAFGDKVGAIVAIDPNNGEILAMLSRPSFDPTTFSRGISTTLWNKLLNNENKPLRDKTIQDWYPPGSVFKLITMIAGLEEGVIDKNTRFVCTGGIKIGNRTYHCHKKGGHGEVGPVDAIVKSCDVFFYRTAQRLKSVDQIASWAVHMGLGRRTGIPLAREVPGLIPTEEWKQKTYKQPWNPGDTLSVAIGQGAVLTTILQLANTYATMANGGTQYRPYFVKRIESIDGKVITESKPEILDTSRLKSTTWDIIKKGLWGVINLPGGTMFSQRLPGMDFVGKTGTAQVISLSKDRIYSKCENMKFKERHHGLFAGFAPVDNPKIAVAVISEHGCHGGSGAGPMARAVIDTYLRKIDPVTYSPEAIAERVEADRKVLSAFYKRKAAEQAAARATDEVDVNQETSVTLPRAGGDD